jgi:Cysteine rich repeat
MLSKACFVAAAVIFVPVLALAEPGPLHGACMSDVKTLCGSIQPGGGRIRDCMREHRAELSTACKVAIADRMLERGRGQPGGTSAAIMPVPKTDH